MNWYPEALTKYATFSGRAQRSEYWYFFLFYLLGFVALLIIDASIGTYSEDVQIGLLSGGFSLGLLIPSIAVTSRRLHDTGKSGWWQLMALIPLIGTIALIAFLTKDSFPASNEHGPNPKEATQ